MFATIIPYPVESVFLEIARESALYPLKVTRVKGNPNSPYKRSLLAFSRTPEVLQEDELVVELERHVYSAEYIALCRDFYLKM